MFCFWSLTVQAVCPGRIHCDEGVVPPPLSFQISSITFRIRAVLHIVACVNCILGNLSRYNLHINWCTKCTNLVLCTSVWWNEIYSGFWQYLSEDWTTTLISFILVPKSKLGDMWRRKGITFIPKYATIALRQHLIYISGEMELNSQWWQECSWKTEIPQWLDQSLYQIVGLYTLKQWRA